MHITHVSLPRAGLLGTQVRGQCTTRFTRAVQFVDYDIRLPIFALTLAHSYEQRLTER